MNKFQSNPILGHITTFGGHPVIARAGHETLKYIIKNDLVSKSSKKEKLFRSLLKHKLIYEIRGKGLMLAIILKNSTLTKKLVKQCLNEGLILFFLLFEPKAVRITPPLTINKKEIIEGCKTIIKVLNTL